MWKYYDTIFFPLFLSSTHVPHFFFFSFFPFFSLCFFSSTHILFHFSFFTTFLFCNLSLLPSSERSSSPSSFFFFFPFYLSNSFLPLLKIYRYSFLFLFSFFPLFFLYSFLLFAFPIAFHRLTELSFSHSFFFFLSTSSVTPMQGIDFFFFFPELIWEFVIDFFVFRFGNLLLRGQSREMRWEEWGLRGNWSHLSRVIWYFSVEPNGYHSNTHSTFCLWTSRGP